MGRSEVESTKFCPNNCYDIHVMDRQATIWLNIIQFLSKYQPFLALLLNA